MSDAVIVAVMGVLMALVNMIGSVLLQWIRAHYRLPNGNGKTPPNGGFVPH